MKKFIAIILFTIITSVLYSQNDKQQLTCYIKYAKVFEKRGAEAVEDGVYSDVIITIRKGSMADCFYGKVTVKDGNVDFNNLFLKFEDDTFEKLDLTFKYDTKEVKIVNGMSEVMFTQDEELVNVLFVKKIKPKKKKYAKAAEPDFDL